MTERAFVAPARIGHVRAVAICIASRASSLHESLRLSARPLLFWTRILLVCAALLPSAAHAQLTAAEVVGAAPHDAELVARVSGQTRDLPLRLRWVELALAAHPSAAQMASAAHAEKAEFVVAIRGSSSAGQTVYVYDAKHDALRTRHVAPSKRERMSRSAAAETVALIVRGELSTLLGERAADAAREATAAVGGGTGVAGGHETDAARERVAAVGGGTSAPGAGGEHTPDTGPASSASTPALAANSGGASSTNNAARPASGARAANLGSVTRGETDEQDDEQDDDASTLTAANPFATALDGPLGIAVAAGIRAGLPIDHHVMWSPSLGVQLRLLHVAFEVHGSTSFSAQLASDSVRIALRRHAFGAAILASWHIGADIAVAFGPALDLVFLHRTTLTTGDGLMKTDAHTPTTLTLGALADVRWSVLPKVGVSMRIGLDFPLHPLQFAYGERELARQRSVEPWALASVFVDIWE